MATVRAADSLTHTSYPTRAEKGNVYAPGVGLQNESSESVSQPDTGASAIRARYRENAAALLAELDALPGLSKEQQQEAAYYRSLLVPAARRAEPEPARAEAA